MKEVQIPFSKEMQQAVLDGWKCTTARSEEKGDVGDVFRIKDNFYRIVHIRPVLLKYNRDTYYLTEGCESFIASTTCLNQATQFTNNSTIARGTISKFRWDFEDNGSWDDSTSNPSHIYPNIGSMFARLQSISNNNCYSFKLNQVIVHANPVAKFKVNSVCLGDNSNFVNLSSCPDGIITSYQWDFRSEEHTSELQS